MDKEIDITIFLRKCFFCGLIFVCLVAYSAGAEEKTYEAKMDSLFTAVKDETAESEVLAGLENNSEIQNIRERYREKVSEYLRKAREVFVKGDMDKASDYIRKAFDIKKEGFKVIMEKARILRKTAKIEQIKLPVVETKKPHPVQSNQVKITRTQKDKDKEKEDYLARSEKESVRKQEKQQKITVKSGKYISRAAAYRGKKDYTAARRYAYMARDIDPLNNEVILLISDIDKEEIFGTREEEAEKVKEKAEINLKEEASHSEKDDPFLAHNGGKGWTNCVADVFTRKVYKATDIQEGKTYSIDECVQLALNRSQRMIMAEKQVKVAEMRIWEARRDVFPSVTGKIERSTGKIGTNTGTRHYQGEKYQVELKQNLFDGMGVWFALRQAQTNLEIVSLERDKIENEIAEEVKTAYYNLDKAIKAFVIQTEYKKKVGSFYDIVEKAYQAEVATHTEYLKIKGQAMQANFQCASSEEDINLAEVMLFQSMNMEPDKRINIRSVESPSDKLSIGMENCYRLALANRPDLKIKEKMIEYYSYERKIKKAEGWPKIDFEGSFGQAYETYQPTEDDTEERGLTSEWYAGVKGSVPVFGNTVEYNYVREKWAPVVSSVHGTESATSYLSLKLLDKLSYFSNLEEAQAGFENAKFEYLKAKKDAAVEVKEAYFKYRKALLQMDVAIAQVSHQEMFINVLEERRRYGEMEATKIVEELEKITEHKYALVQGETSYFTALTELNRVIGLIDYFKPEYENMAYNEWKENRVEKPEIRNQKPEYSVD